MLPDTLNVQSISIPRVGLGTYKLTGSEGVKSIEDALHIGYRHIDTAQMYANETEVGKAIRQSVTDRDNVFITTKVWPSDFKRLLPAVEDSLRKLKTETIDLLLLHWPSDDASNQKGLELLNEALHKGYTRLAGVSNFNTQQLEQAVRLAPIVCNQVEYHPFLSQEKMLADLKQHNLFLTAYRPLAQGKVATDPVLSELAEKYGKTPSQVALRWLVQQEDIVVIPKASSADRRKENLAVFDFELSPEDMEIVFSLGKNERLTDPEWAPKWD